MREVLDVGVARHAGQDGVDAGLMLGRIDEDAATRIRLHAGLSMAGQASRVVGRILGLARAPVGEASNKLPAAARNHHSARLGRIICLVECVMAPSFPRVRA